jgi:hypothetical protein
MNTIPKGGDKLVTIHTDAHRTKGVEWLSPYLLKFIQNIYSEFTGWPVEYCLQDTQCSFCFVCLVSPKCYQTFQISRIINYGRGTLILWIIHFGHFSLTLQPTEEGKFPLKT